MSTKSTQYNEIANGYAELHSNVDIYPAAQFEEANVYHVVKDLIKGKRLLELACGSGFYTQRYLEWGAESIVALDISSGMVELAQKEAEKAGVDQSKLSFVVADATACPDLSSRGAPFDIVVSSWLLNYASDVEVMTAMWRTISSNLRPGGTSIALTVSPPVASKEALDRDLHEQWKKYGVKGKVLRELKDNFETTMVLGFDGNTQVEFDCFYPRNEMFEAAAKAGGMEGGFEWQPIVLPEGLRSKHPKGFFNDAVLLSWCRVCLAWK